MGTHLIDGEFQSKVPLSVKDPLAQDLLWEYAQRRRAVDAEFSADLETALRSHGYVHPTIAGESIDQRAVEVATKIAEQHSRAPEPTDAPRIGDAIRAEVALALANDPLRKRAQALLATTIYDASGFRFNTLPTPKLIEMLRFIAERMNDQNEPLPPLLRECAARIEAGERDRDRAVKEPNDLHADIARELDDVLASRGDDDTVPGDVAALARMYREARIALTNDPVRMAAVEYGKARAATTEGPWSPGEDIQKQHVLDNAHEALLAAVRRAASASPAKRAGR